MAIGNKETDEDGKKSGASMERSKAGKKSSPDGLSHPNHKTIIINIIC